MSVYTGYSASQFLFDRDWSVLLQPQAITGYDGMANAIYGLSSQGYLFARQQANQVQTATNGAFNNLRVTFDFEKTSEGLADKGKVEIWNLNPESRKLYQKGMRLTLKAGYAGLLKTIYTGDTIARDSKIERRGSDIVSVFALGAFEAQINTNVFYKSYPAGTYFSFVIRDVAQVLGASISTIIGVNDFFYTRPLTLFGRVSESLDYLCASNNLEWHVNNDELLILPLGGSYTNQAIVLASGLDQTGNTTPNTGLTGIPSVMQNGVVNFSCLLNPDVVPGQLVQVISQNVNGFFIIRKCHYKGDSHGHDWHIDCESSIDYQQNVQQVSENDVLNFAFNSTPVA